MTPTGAVTIVAGFVAESRKCEERITTLVENNCWTTAVEQKLQAEKLKEQAGIEFLLWTISRLDLPTEPDPWKELLAKEKDQNATEDL